MVVIFSHWHEQLWMKLFGDDPKLGIFYKALFKAVKIEKVLPKV